MSLLLHVHKPWFDAIAHGYKKYEYRRVTPYWTKRIVDKPYAKIVFQNGYGSRFPTMDVEYLGYDIQANESGEPYYRLKLGSVSNVVNYSLSEVQDDPGACMDLNRCLDAHRPRDCMRFCAARGTWMPRPLAVSVEVNPDVQTGRASPVPIAITGGGTLPDTTPPRATKPTVVGDVTLCI